MRFCGFTRVCGKTPPRIFKHLCPVFTFSLPHLPLPPAVQLMQWCRVTQVGIATLHKDYVVGWLKKISKQRNLFAYSAHTRIQQNTFDAHSLTHRLPLLHFTLPTQPPTPPGAYSSSSSIIIKYHAANPIEGRN